MPAIGIIVAIIAVLGLGALAVTNNGGANSNQQQASETASTFTEIQADIKQGARLLDVRTKEEYDAGHFAGSTLLPLQQLESGTMPDVPKETMIYVHCRSGSRSSQAVDILRDAGYTNVVDLGGISEVQSLGGTLTQ